MHALPIAYFRATDRIFQHLHALSAGLLPLGHPLSGRARDDLHRLHERCTRVRVELRALLKPHTAVCSDCRGRCCQRPADHYLSMLDRWSRLARHGTPHPAPSLDAPGRTATCEYLTERGCALEDHERPARCVAYVCPTLAAVLPRRDRGEVASRAGSLIWISVRKLQVLAREAAARPPGVA
jgi:hypothetical protein